MQFLWEKFKDELHNQTVTLTDKLTTMVSEVFEEKVRPIIEENQVLKQEVKTLQNKVNWLENNARKNNVILHGIPEKENTNSELLEIVLDTLNNVSENAKIENWDKWEISRATRLGKKNDKKVRPILIILTLSWRKFEILRNKKYLPKDIYVTDDFPKDVLNKRNELKPKLLEERNKGKIAYLRYDKLIIRDNVVLSDKRKRSPSKSPEFSTEKQQGGKTTNNPNKINKINAFSYMRTKSFSKNGSSQ
ncbi:uncharacterized protein LOC128202593 [Galleria mellonella]|uniref:Uncharacterized protein LOC128202593 n=1 Tax=Galleria mellonella TaxID=7137 RepID=A0ABM3N733_GALME|nr:uncharacterized protein LOC128202593 [Galleria mellonella]